MKNFFVFLTFIPWILYFISLSKIALKDFHSYKLNKKWLKKNILKVFQFDKLILIAIFIYFSLLYPDANQVWLVEIMLFSVINLYLYINNIYNKTRNKVSKEDVKEILFILLFMIVPIIIFSITKNQSLTYYIMFGYSFFNYLIVFLSVKLSDLINKII